MSVSAFYFNPFALSHAKRAWNDPEKTLPVKILKTMSGAGYDIFIENPYNLTVGNCKKWKSSDIPLSLTTKISVTATVVLGTCYTLMLYGTSFYLLGKVIALASNKFASPTLLKIGQAVEKVGKNIFLSGAVPLYALFYAAPKHLIQSLPQAAKFAAEKAFYAAKWTFTHVLTPLFERLVAAIQFLSPYVSNALKFLADKVALASQFVYKNMLIPLLKGLQQAILFAGAKIGIALEAICKGVVQAVRWIFEKYFIPFVEKVIFPGVKSLGNALMNAIKNIAPAIDRLANAIVHAAGWIFTNALVPLWKSIGEGTRYIGQYVIQPCISGLGYAIDKIGAVAHFVFNTVISPLASTIYSTASLVGSSLKELTNELIESIRFISESFFVKA